MIFLSNQCTHGPKYWVYSGGKKGELYTSTRRIPQGYAPVSDESYFGNFERWSQNTPHHPPPQAGAPSTLEWVTWRWRHAHLRLNEPRMFPWGFRCVGCFRRKIVPHLSKSSSRLPVVPGCRCEPRAILERWDEAYSRACAAKNARRSVAWRHRRDWGRLVRHRRERLRGSCCCCLDRGRLPMRHCSRSLLPQSWCSTQRPKTSTRCSGTMRKQNKSKENLIIVIDLNCSEEILAYVCDRDIY